MEMGSPSADLEERKEGAREMIAAGVDLRMVAKETGLDLFQLMGIASGIAKRSKAKKRTSAKKRAVQGSSSERVAEEGSERLEKAEKQKLFLEEDLRAFEPKLYEAFERELSLVATPVIRKVVLNPKVLMWYDYAVSNFGYKGDLGDFLVDCVEDFWMSRGYKIKIVKEEEAK